MNLTQTMNPMKELSFNKLVICPACYRKLCKLTTVKGKGLVHFKHKGAELYAPQAYIRCVGCQAMYDVHAEEGILNGTN